MLLESKVAIVTGGGRGIGRAIAHRFADEGASVVVAARSRTEVEEVAAEIQKCGQLKNSGKNASKAHAVVADVSREVDCEKLVRAAQKAFGAVDILVNNAGAYGPVRPAEHISPKEWDEVIATNLRGPFLLSRLLLPAMYERGSGVILNITSIAAKAAFPLNGPYAASKAGLMGLTRTLAAEGAKKGVRVNAISPGPVPETKMSQELGNRLAEYFQADRDALFQAMLAGILQGRPQTAEEIAAAAVFLVGDQSSAITGQILNVDGGMAFC